MLLKFLKKHFPQVKYPVKYIIRHQALGDVLWVEPVIQKLLVRCSRVVCISDYPELFEHYPDTRVSFRRKLNVVERIIHFFDKLLGANLLFINLTQAYERRPNMHLLLAYFMVSKVNDKIVYPKLYFSDAELEAYSVAAGKYVVLHIEEYPANNNYRNVYGIDWQQVASKLTNEGYEVVQIGRKNFEIAGTRYLQTSIREMMRLIKKACFFIGPDSGPSQVAAALGTPAIIFFGSVNPLYRHRPDMLKGIILQQPCEYAGCFHEDFNRVRRTCILFGQQGIPKCSLHSDESVMTAIDNLIFTYNL